MKVDRGLAVVVMTIVGGFIALQAPINAGLGRHTGSLPAALISFGVGTLVLAAIVIASGKAGGLSGAGEVSAVYLIGGALGAAYVITSLIVVSSIGAGGVAAATITGQLIAAVAIDRAGILGLDVTPLSASRLLGVVLLLAGTVLIVR